MDNVAGTEAQADRQEAVEKVATPDAGNPVDARNRPKSEGSRKQRLSRLAGIHGLIVLAALAMFAAADSWSVVTGLGIAALLSVITAVLAGVAIATLVHEWFHYLGARYTDARFDIPAKAGLFVFNWDFSSNSARQFLTMSIAGSIGGVVSVILLCYAVPADSVGRTVLRCAAIASVIYASLIEWPVIRRIRNGGEPLAELSKIDPPLLSRSFVIV